MNDTKYTELENGLAKDKLQGLFDQLRPKAIWYPEENLVWIKSFVKRQGKSPKFLVAAGRCLEVINNKKNYLRIYKLQQK